MLTKIIDLGCEVPETGEPRVQLIRKDLVKTAATEIQTFWDSIGPDDENSYLWVIGVSAREFYGCNNNGDAFDEDELRKTHEAFTNSAHVFVQHVNKDPAKSIGKPVFSWYNEPMHRVELILKVDKKVANAAETVKKIVEGTPIFVSMGCTVDHDVCSICGNEAKTRKDYCDHLRYNMKKILEDGRQVYALNPNPKFFDISIVARPADPTAFTLDKRASENGFDDPEKVVLSADLGEASNVYAQKIASLNKIGDIIKKVEGQVVDAKDNTFSAVSKIREQGFDKLDYPEMPYATLSNIGLSPAGFISGMASLGAPITLSDAAWIGGSQAFGRCPTDAEMGSIFSMLPKIIGMLSANPSVMDTALRGACCPYFNELENPVTRTIVIRVMRPVARARIQIIQGLGSPVELEKIGTVLGKAEYDDQVGTTTKERILNAFRSRRENFSTVTLHDEHGNEAQTTPYYLRQAAFQNVSTDTPLVKPALIGALALGTLGAVMTQPDLLGKAIALAAMGVPAVVVHDLLVKGRGGDVRDHNGHMLPQTMVAGAYKFEKKASALRMGTVAGMAIPGALALDYAYNRWRYPFGNPEGENVLDRAGKFITDHPAASVIGAGLAGSQAGAALSKIVGRLRK